jgi:hypothetical protein
MGLTNIHKALSMIEGQPIETRDEKALWAAALAGEDSLAAAAFDRYCLSLGAIAGDIALAQAPTRGDRRRPGQRIADHLPRSGFRGRFIAKGRFERRMDELPVKLITHPSRACSARPRRSRKGTAVTIDAIMRTAPVIPVLVIEDAAHARSIAEALVEGGLAVLEVTLRTAAALDVIREMSEVPGAIVGCRHGSERRAARQACAAGRGSSSRRASRSRSPAPRWIAACPSSPASPMPATSCAGSISAWTASNSSRRGCRADARRSPRSPPRSAMPASARPAGSPPRRQAPGSPSRTSCGRRQLDRAQGAPDLGAIRAAARAAAALG